VHDWAGLDHMHAGPWDWAALRQFPFHGHRLMGLGALCSPKLAAASGLTYHVILNLLVVFSCSFCLSVSLSICASGCCSSGVFLLGRRLVLLLFIVPGAFEILTLALKPQILSLVICDCKPLQVTNFSFVQFLKTDFSNIGLCF